MIALRAPRDSPADLLRRPGRQNAGTVCLLGGFPFPLPASRRFPESTLVSRFLYLTLIVPQRPEKLFSDLAPKCRVSYSISYTYAVECQITVRYSNCVSQLAGAGGRERRIVGEQCTCGSAPTPQSRPAGCCERILSGGNYRCGSRCVPLLVISAVLERILVGEHIHCGSRFASRNCLASCCERILSGWNY